MQAYVIRHRGTGQYFSGYWRDGELSEAYWGPWSAGLDFFSDPDYPKTLFERIVDRVMTDGDKLRARDLEVVGFELNPPANNYRNRLIVAGIGSRATPAEVCAEMEAIGAWCRDHGIVLRSGHAEGADIAFERGVDSALAEIWLPWKSYNRATRLPASTYRVTEMNQELWNIVQETHPAPANLSQGARLLMARNAQIILGADLRSPVGVVVCWTPDEENGGTSFGIRLARRHGIPVINMAKAHNLRAETVCAELEHWALPTEA